MKGGCQRAFTDLYPDRIIGCRGLFLSPGLTRVYRPQNQDRADGISMLLETDASKAYCRNILALASVFVVAGLVGVDPVLCLS